MALNPYTLYHLYEKGVLPYVPEDLMMGTPVAPMTSMSNPYLELAQQGGLYQNHGNYNDSFQMNGGVQTPYANPIYSQPHIGMMSQAGGMNAVNGVGIGGMSQAGGINAFNGVGIGSMSQTGGMNAFNGVGIGGMSQAGGENAFGGFAGVGEGLAGGYNKTMSVINRTPKFVMGVIAAAIGFIGIKHAFRGGRVKHSGGLLSKLNPLNWFKSAKKKI